MKTNQEIIMNFYDSFKTKDVSWQDFCHEEIEWNTMEGMPNGGRYVGIKAIIKEYFPKMLSNFQEFHAHANKFLESKDMVIVFGKYQIRGHSGEKSDVPFCHVYTMKEGKILKFQQFTDTLKIQSLIPNKM